ncbi:unnamed protein product [Caretta caretta]
MNMEGKEKAEELGREWKVQNRAGQVQTERSIARRSNGENWIAKEKKPNTGNQMESHSILMNIHEQLVNYS